MDFSLAYRSIIRGYSALPRLLAPGRCFPPLQLYLEITYRCNLSCTFCQFQDSSGHIPQQKKQELEIEGFRQIIQEVPRWSLVSFSGGEPFLKKGFMDLLEWTSRRNKVHIFTNATRIDAKKARTIIKSGAGNFTGKGLVLLSISMHGLEATHERLTQSPGSCRKAWQAIRDILHFRKKMRRKYPLIELKTVVTPDNVAELYPLFLAAKSHEVDIFNIITINSLPQISRIQQGTPANYREYPPAPPRLDVQELKTQLQMIQKERQSGPTQVRSTPQVLSMAQIVDYYNNELPLTQFACHYPWYGATVSAHGQVFICPYLDLGNVRDKPLPELLAGPAAQRFRKLLHKERVFPGCQGCCMLTPRISFDGPD